MKMPPMVADRETLRVQLPSTSRDLLCHVSFDGRRVWTFRAYEGSWDAEAGFLVIDWPPALALRLSGHAVLSVSAHLSASPDAAWVCQETVRFDQFDEPLRLIDPGSGTGLVVNKWGRLAKSFESKSDDFMSEVLCSAQKLASVVKSKMNIELFVTGGTLLGPIRDGRVMPNDDDADLAYLSGHQNPSDVVLESYEMERVLLREGFEVVRHSSGHLQIMFPGNSLGDDYYVDIFSYFVCNGWFYGTFHARTLADQVLIHPLKPIAVNGVVLQAPADPEGLLTAIYGRNWSVPDPTFKFVTPPSAARRYYWWLNHFDAHREDWEDYHRSLLSESVACGHSNFAEWVASEVAEGSSVLELGCGLGGDARHYSLNGHQVLAADYSRPAIGHSRAAHSPDGAAPTFVVANVYSYRHAAMLVARSSQLRGPVNVVTKNLLEGLHPLGRDVVLFSTRHLLGRGGKAFFRVGVPGPHGASPRLRPKDEPFDPGSFEQRVSFHGLKVLSVRESRDPLSSESNLDYTIGEL